MINILNYLLLSLIILIVFYIILSNYYVLFIIIHNKIKINIKDIFILVISYKFNKKLVNILIFIF